LRIESLHEQLGKKNGRQNCEGRVGVVGNEVEGVMKKRREKDF
jgi:hypothetical protein